MSEALTVLARNAAGNYFRMGYNCAESVLRAYIDLLPDSVEPKTTRLATVFGGGLGHAGCTCGALTGSEMVLGMLIGRDDIIENEKDKLQEIYRMSRELHNRFNDQFGSTCCRVLNNGTDYESKDHLRRCLKITGTAATLLAQFLIDNDLVK